MGRHTNRRVQSHVRTTFLDLVQIRSLRRMISTAPLLRQTKQAEILALGGQHLLAHTLPTKKKKERHWIDDGKLATDEQKDALKIDLVA